VPSCGGYKGSEARGVMGVGGGMLEVGMCVAVDGRIGIGGP
jgi:hypothetical protein